MSIATTKAQLTFEGVRISLARSPLLGDVNEQVRRLESNERHKRLYGSDLAMLGTGDLVLSTDAPGTKDLDTVSGVINYAQAIIHRMMTPRGYHPADPSFGVPWYSYLGQSYRSRSTVVDQLTLDITDELLKDRRTQRVSRMAINFESPNVVSVSCEVVPTMLTPGEFLSVDMTARN